MGVIYLYCQYHKINGTVYYAFEHFVYLLKYNKDCKFYIVDLDDDGYQLFIGMFKDKYDVPEEVFQNIISIKRTELFKKQLTKSLILDIRTFQTLQHFLTGKIHCFSNESHDNITHGKHYNVTYYGSYNYQVFSVFNYLKLNFEIFKNIEIKKTEKVFISSRVDPKFIDYSLFQTTKEIYQKITTGIVDNLFQIIDEIIYYHVKLDTNNRIIPEAFFYNIPISIVKSSDTQVIIDSTILRYNDIVQGNLKNYYLDENDEMIKGMLC